MKRYFFHSLQSAVISLLAFFALLAFTLFSAPSDSQAKERLFRHFPELKLNVVRVIDDDFTNISNADYEQITQEAKRMFAEKYGVDSIEFVDKGSLSIEEFFDQYLQTDSEIYKRKEGNRYRIGEQNDFKSFESSIISFLKNWKVKELQGFFPKEERSVFKTHEDFSQAIMQQMQRKIEQIALMEVGGKRLLREEKQKYRSFINWLAALEIQQVYDVVLTNTFILYDDIAHPSPHSIFDKGKVGGVSHRNDALDTLSGRVIMTSTFGMDTDMPQFTERKDGKKVDRATRNLVTGGYVLAHEIAHAIIKLPDQYDHGAECLMQNEKGRSYLEGYELLQKHPQSCKKCTPWIEARDHFFTAEWLFNKKKFTKAISEYIKVIQKTPQNIDGHRQKYMAYVAYKMSLAFYELKQYDMAIKGAKRAAALHPREARYADWQKRLESELKKQ